MRPMAEKENLSPTAKRRRLLLSLKKSPLHKTTVLQASHFRDPVTMDEAEKAAEV